ncbi:enoyl-CoA hydratase/isomerase family protein [Vibrio coralliilyticus]|uniref:enoyl-CoA hydratase/isomerase family protein n=1 Tax=Vibrio coralliilyticus TaxID=190893 RepID=UPI001561849A|nr:enoyl-CoA hydratase/isomerase family protein [Vibrio coralliilyticus]NRF30716.1 enoyl-CoA hydratase/isomerase family protein [Vibrio coralliilyticus]NRF54158.1 enoyl-CoA hydratase/isomerase family protein [Vibrio coralliilyticus]NRG03330.1 enoyl-CoA hydratase/isomerase family protein [Vibrio coralliilyticus]
MTATVHFKELSCQDGNTKIGVATLDNAPSLNALTYNMLALLKEKLENWQEDDSIACVFLEGRGEKAFCAGGDVRTMHDVMRDKSSQEIEAFCTTFFKLEYECDYLIHTYCKPIIAWGEGIIMGGGMGLYMGSSHKVVTPSTRLAMPEVSIGLYPDVGATWFLNRLEPGVGLFLGLTGVMINGSDALDVNLADHMVLSEEKESLVERLLSLLWDEQEDAYEAVTDLLVEFGDKVNGHKPDAQMEPFMQDIQRACSASDVVEVSKNILDLEGQSKWLDVAKRNHASGSPITSHICFRQLNQYKDLSLADCFRLELNLSVRSGLLGEFREGVRARLIDKDGEPKWQFSRVDNVDTAVIDTLFASLWDEKSHPLAQLGHY